MITEITENEAGCWLSNSRGHYILRDVIDLAVGFGFIVGSTERFMLDKYDECGHEEDYPFDTLVELADEAVRWLNIGENSGLERPMKGQNQPPHIPEGYMWDWFDGDFGLYRFDDDGERVFDE